MTSNMRTRVSLAIAATAGALMLGVMPLADAIVITGNTSNVSIEQIDVNRTATLILRKKPPNPYNTTPVADLPAGTISNVTFTIQRVAGIDLSTQEGWDWVAEAEVYDVLNGPFDVEFTAKTDYEGYARVDGVPVGVYLVTEVGIDNPSHLYRKSAPFLLTVPSGSADGTFWNYEITVNTKGTPEAPPTTPTTPTTPDNPPPPTTPATPTTTPQQPGTPGQPGQPGPPSRSDLARTGASVLGVVGLGAALVAAGVLLVRRRRRQA